MRVHAELDVLAPLTPQPVAAETVQPARPLGAGPYPREINIPSERTRYQVHRSCHGRSGIGRGSDAHGVGKRMRRAPTMSGPRPAIEDERMAERYVWRAATAIPSPRDSQGRLDF